MRRRICRGNKKGRKMYEEKDKDAFRDVPRYKIVNMTAWKKG